MVTFEPLSLRMTVSSAMLMELVELSMLMAMCLSLMSGSFVNMVHTARGLSAILSAVWLSQQGLATLVHKKARTDRWSKSRCQ